MRIVVTGAGNPAGAAVVRALLADGHEVRLFGVDESVARGFGEGVQWHPGDLCTPGSIEPVLSERQALVHAACLDPPGKDRMAHVRKVERGTLYARYGAEREQVDHFIHLAPLDAGRFEEAHENAVAAVEATRGTIHTKVLHVSGDAEEAARHVLAALREGGRLGKQPGRESDAVTV